MDAQRLEDTLSEALAELRQTRQQMLQLAGAVIDLWRRADEDGHAFGPPLPEQMAVNALAPWVQQHLQGAGARQNGEPTAPSDALTLRGRKRGKRG